MHGCRENWEKGHHQILMSSTKNKKGFYVLPKTIFLHFESANHCFPDVNILKRTLFDSVLGVFWTLAPHIQMTSTKGSFFISLSFTTLSKHDFLRKKTFAEAGWREAKQNVQMKNDFWISSIIYVYECTAFVFNNVCVKCNRNIPIWEKALFSTTLPQNCRQYRLPNNQSLK